MISAKDQTKEYRKRRTLWKAVNRARARHVRAIRRLWAEKIRAYLIGGDPLAIGEAMERTYIEVGGQFARAVYRRLKGQKDIGDINDEIDAQMLGYVRTEMGNVVKSIQDTSVRQYTNILAADLTLSEQADLIDKMIINKAKSISANEITNASNYGDLLGANNYAMETGNRVIKTWIATIDSVVRPEHEAADGQSRWQNEDFDIGGIGMAAPGDPRGGVENTINCRCVMDLQKVEATN